MRFPFFRSKDKAPAPAARPAMGGDEAQVQAARTRARRRLVGALVLLVMGVVGFPLLFETQPRPLPVDTPILVPEGTPGTPGTPGARGTPARVTAPPAAVARPLPTPPPDAGTESAVAPVQLGGAASAPMQTAAAEPASAPAPRAEPAPAPKPPAATKPQPPPAPVVVASVPAKPAAEPAAEPAASAATGRFVVQVGAYNDTERLKAARSKLEKMGYKSYTQEVDSPSGKRTRVRVGPYGSRQEADAVAVKLKAAGMQVAILSL